MISRRWFLRTGGAVTLISLGGACRPEERIEPTAAAGEASASSGSVVVNDVHSQLNSTEVLRVVNADSVDALRDAVGRAAAEATPVSLAGGRHAMGGQQFGTDMVLIDTARMNHVVDVG